MADVLGRTAWRSFQSSTRGNLVSLSEIFGNLFSLGLWRCVCEFRILFEPAEQMLYDVLTAGFLLQGIMFDGDFQTILLRVLLILDGALFRHCRHSLAFG